MLPVTRARTPLIGINDIRVIPGSIHWASSDKRLFCRLPVDDNGNLTGSVEIGVHGDTFFDDFISSLSRDQGQ